MRTSNSELVRRASHCHQTPHALRPHSGPVTRTQAPKRTASSAEETASRSPASDPLKRKAMLPAAQANVERNSRDAHGT